MSNRDGAGGARILGRGAVWPVLLLGFLVGANAPAHPTAEMLKARLAVHTWANGFLNRDMETMASILDPEPDHGRRPEPGAVPGEPAPGHAQDHPRLAPLRPLPGGG